MRDQYPIRLFKVRYYEDRALDALFEGQGAGVSLKEPDVMVEAELPGAIPGLRGVGKPEHEAEQGKPRRVLAVPPHITVERSAAKLGVIKAKQGDLRIAVAAYRQEGQADRY